MSLHDAIERTRVRWGRASVPRWSVQGRQVVLVYGFPRLGECALLVPVVDALLRAGARPPWVVGQGLMKPVLRASGLPFHYLDGFKEIHPLDADFAFDLSLRTDFPGRAWVRACTKAVKAGFVTQDLPAEDFDHAVQDRRPLALEPWIDALMAPLAPLSLTVRLPLPTPPRNSVQNDGWPSGTGSKLLLVPGARDPERRWPEDLFIQWGRDHTTRRRGRVLVVGSPAETELLDAVRRGVGRRCRVYAGGIQGLFDRVLRADAVVSNDTGPMHLAWIWGRPTAALFSTMSVRCWGPHPASGGVHRVFREQAKGAGPVSDWLDGVLACAP